MSLQVCFRGGKSQTVLLPPVQLAWQSWETRPEVIAEIDRLLDDHTDQQVADLLNAQGLQSGRRQTFNSHIIARLRRVYHMKSYFSRLRDRGLLTSQEMATRLDVTTTCVRAWGKEGLLRFHAYNSKPDYLYEWPVDGNLPSKHQGKKLSERRRFPESHIQPCDGGAS